MWRFYAEVAWTSFKRQQIYRWANIAGLLANAFFGAFFSYLTIALFQARPNAAGYDVGTALRYTWIAQSLIMVVLSFGWYDLMLTIRGGEVVTDLARPCDLCWYWFSREAGRAAYYILYRGIPTYLIGMLLFHIGMPGDWRNWAGFALALALGAAVGIAYRVLYNLAAFWLVEARPVGLLATIVALFGAGSYVPLPFFPDGLRAVVLWLPFNGLLNAPAQILLGKEAGWALALEIARQAVWFLALTLLVRAIMARASRRIVVQGG